MTDVVEEGKNVKAVQERGEYEKIPPTKNVSMSPATSSWNWSRFMFMAIILALLLVI